MRYYYKIGTRKGAPVCQKHPVIFSTGNGDYINAMQPETVEYESRSKLKCMTHLAKGFYPNPFLAWNGYIVQKEKELKNLKESIVKAEALLTLAKEYECK